MFWYNVISHNPSYYFKMYISEKVLGWELGDLIPSPSSVSDLEPL